MNRVTFCRVRITTPDTPFGPSQTFEWTPDNHGALDGLMGVSVQQGVDALRNSFVLRFAPVVQGGLTWAERIPRFSLVQIEMGSSEHPGDDPLVMIGLTKMGAHQAAFAERIQRQVVVQGEGIEAVLWDANIWFAPYLDIDTAARSEALRRAVDAPTRNAIGGNAQLQWVQEILGAGTGQAAVYDPREMLAGVLRYFIGNGATSVFSLAVPGQPLHQLLVPGEFNAWFERETGRGARVLVPPSWSVIDDRIRMAFAQYRPEPGPIGAHCEKLVDRMFHDFFVRYEDGRARLAHRVKPFKATTPRSRVIDGLAGGPSLFDLEAVRTVEVTGDDVRQAGLQQSMPIANFFWVLPGFHSATGQQHFKAAFAPSFSTSEDFSNVGRFGLRAVEHVSPYMILDRQTEGDATTPEESKRIGTAIALAMKLSETLKVWMDPHPEMWAGTLVIRGRAGVRPGDRVVWTGPDAGPYPLEFHVKAVSHSYSFEDGAFVTQLQVERGWRVKDAVVDSGQGPSQRQAPAARDVPA